MERVRHFPPESVRAEYHESAQKVFRQGTSIFTEFFGYFAQQFPGKFLAILPGVQFDESDVTNEPVRDLKHHITI